MSVGGEREGEIGRGRVRSGFDRRTCHLRMFITSPVPEPEAVTDAILRPDASTSCEDAECASGVLNLADRLALVGLPERAKCREPNWDAPLSPTRGPHRHVVPEALTQRW